MRCRADSYPAIDNNEKAKRIAVIVVAIRFGLHTHM